MEECKHIKQNLQNFIMCGPTKVDNLCFLLRRGHFVTEGTLTFSMEKSYLALTWNKYKSAEGTSQ